MISNAPLALSCVLSQNNPEQEKLTLSEPLQLPTAVPEEIQKAITEFHNLLSDYKAMGYTFRATDMIAYPAKQDAYGLEMLLVNSNKLSVSSGETPAEVFQYRYGAEKELPEGYRRSEALELVTCRLQLSQSPEGKLVVTAYDCINTKDPIIGRWEVALDADGFVDIAQAKNLPEELSAALKARNQGHAAIIDEQIKPVAISTPAFTLGAPIDQNSADKMNELLATYKLKGDAIKANAAVDDAFGLANSKLSSRPSNIVISPTGFEKTNHASIQIDGQLHMLLLDREQSVEVTEYDKQENTVNGIPIASRCTDQYGNVMSRLLVVSSDEQTVSDLVTIYPPVCFAKAGEAADTMVPVNIDLSKLGADFAGMEIKGLFQQKIATLISNEGAYGLYSNLEHSKAREVVEPHIDSVVQGIADAEALFGLPSGGLVKNIYLVRGNEPNAHFGPQNPDTVVMRDSLFNRLAANDSYAQISLAARHETYHAVDHLTKDTLSSSSFAQAFNSMKGAGSKFLTEINEVNFLEISDKHDDITLGGHAATNVDELFATFCNSLTHPNWHERIAEQSPEFRDDYSALLKALQTNLKNTEFVASTAPVHGLVAERLTFLESFGK